MEKTTGIVVPSQELEEKCELAVTSSINEVNRHNTAYVTAFNMTEVNLTLPFKTDIGKFSILTLTEYKNLIKIEPQTLASAKMNQPESVELGINEIISQKKSPSLGSEQKPPPEYKKFWFPTPKTCPNPESLPSIQREIYDQIL